jgi:hypothetical protein
MRPSINERMSDSLKSRRGSLASASRQREGVNPSSRFMSASSQTGATEIVDLNATTKTIGGGAGAAEDSFDEHPCRSMINCCKKCEVVVKYAWKNSDPLLEYEVLRLPKHEPENKQASCSTYVKKLSIFIVLVTFISVVLADQLGLYGSIKQ